MIEITTEQTVIDSRKINTDLGEESEDLLPPLQNKGELLLILSIDENRG